MHRQRNEEQAAIIMREKNRFIEAGPTSWPENNDAFKAKLLFHHILDWDQTGTCGSKRGEDDGEIVDNKKCGNSNYYFRRDKNTIPWPGTADNDALYNRDKWLEPFTDAEMAEAVAKATENCDKLFPKQHQQRKVEVIFVHDGRCAAGYISDSIGTAKTVEGCGMECSNIADCGYISYEPPTDTCMFYRKQNGCPDDNNFATYDSYEVKVWCLEVSPLAHVRVTPYCVGLFHMAPFEYTTT